jgi:hypothetical protein
VVTTCVATLIVDVATVLAPVVGRTPWPITGGRHEADH